MDAITDEQLAAVKARANNVTTRALERDGATLTYEQADELGDEGLDWLHRRLSLQITETDACVELRPWDEG